LGVRRTMPHLHARLFASSRRKSEDRAEVFERGADVVVVIADGAGGLAGGAAASGALVEDVRSKVEDRALDVHDAQSWVHVFRTTDAKLAARMVGETTGVVVVVGAHQLTGVSAGDSEAWLIHSRSIDYLTESQKKARLGSGRAEPIQIERRAVEGWLVVATDGLFKYAAAEDIAVAVRAGGDAPAIVRHLARLAQTPSGTYHDDLGVVVVILGQTGSRG
jgi:serine/threonine protein phosphatase PrpC